MKVSQNKDLMTAIMTLGNRRQLVKIRVLYVLHLAPAIHLPDPGKGRSLFKKCGDKRSKFLFHAVDPAFYREGIPDFRPYMTSETNLQEIGGRKKVPGL